MRFVAIVAGAAVALAFAVTSAEARPGIEVLGDSPVSLQFERDTSLTGRGGRRGIDLGTGGGGRYAAGPRPGRWCGWWMRTQLGGGPQFNVAWNWRNYGSPTSAQVGAVVVWRGHVGIITGQASNGQWIVKSGNDGGRVRERARSVAGAIFRI
jgi:hypothetical protein